jgi:hypothetical protein
MTAAMAWVRPVWRQTHELDTGESAGFSEGRNAVQRRRLAVTNVQPEDLAAAVGGHAGGDDDRWGDDPSIDPGLESVASRNTEGKAVGPATGTGTPRPRRPARHRSG